MLLCQSLSTRYYHTIQYYLPPDKPRYHQQGLYYRTPDIINPDIPNMDIVMPATAET
jgi:hypothetical protein